MSNLQKYTIEVSSRFEGWWRYNVEMMAGCFDKEDRRTGFSTASSDIAEVGANLREAPAGTELYRRAKMTPEACDHLLLYIYIIPHTLPEEEKIEETEPFEISVKVSCGTRVIAREQLPINQWAGASLEMRIANDKVD